jgi:hypothetical protein
LIRRAIFQKNFLEILSRCPATLKICPHPHCQPGTWPKGILMSVCWAKPGGHPGSADLPPVLHQHSIELSHGSLFHLDRTAIRPTSPIIRCLMNRSFAGGQEMPVVVTSKITSEMTSRANAAKSPFNTNHENAKDERTKISTTYFVSWFRLSVFRDSN